MHYAKSFHLVQEMCSVGGRGDMAILFSLACDWLCFETKSRGGQSSGEARQCYRVRVNPLRHISRARSNEFEYTQINVFGTSAFIHIYNKLKEITRIYILKNIHNYIYT